jgi:flagellar biosynthetic protein FliS
MSLTPSAVHRRAYAAYEALHFSVDARGDDRRHLIEMLLDGLAASLSNLSRAERAADLDARRSAVLRASRIVAGLQNALNPTADQALVRDLSSVYQYFLFRLNRAHRGPGQDTASELLELTNILKNAFSPS